MSLIKCPECSNFVSDTAVQCPKCGYSIKDNLDSIQKTKLPLQSQNVNTAQKPNNGCGIVVLILIIFGFLIFLVNKCSDSNTKKNTDISTKTEIETKISKEDSIKNQARIDSIDKKDKIEEEKFMKTKAGKIYKKHPEWSKEDCIGISERKIWIGMSYEMLVYMRGKPNNVNTSNYGDGLNYQACWYDYDPSCFYFGENHIITSYN
ncbi:hypothetical protein ASG22_04710 [Chryseobacterium sp. Leaf405]|uniref:hypothetical protein n=1 Tax=Chryseobacterium sp. Leaf405 TaxID=1736367 RepID=UPI0006F2F0AD|nr:hypothetical protein [Chryseobacterium sp. Leaf405]KQT25998.1 hypothetical protein ASG22_04710 [Chryseobacterium sp. Leaf405]